MSQSTSDSKQNKFSDIVDGLSEEHKTLITEQIKLKDEETALDKEEADLQEAQEELNINRLSIGQALFRWSLMHHIVESNVEKLREKKKALHEKKTRVQDKINLFENLLPSSK
ncbi:hypothetical protein [Parasitella parasitica]|uniref:Uncharacterized protein n=1 Tax=Parasitella parasitica TaxID=35722 RepID=A0A0B7MT03_9FUNG|nr:hypothetical protein [Parasitella parasitica]